MNMNNVKINKFNSVRDLGVQVDSKLTFSEHTEIIVSKAYKSLGFVLRVSRPFADIDCLKILYYSYVRSILEYCTTVWNPQYIIYTDSIESIQNKFVKHLNYRCYSNFKDYHDSCLHHRLTTLKSRRILADMSFLHGICNGYIDSPELLSKILTLCTPKTRTRHTKLFAIAQTSTNYAQNSIVNRLHNCYNKRFDNIDIFYEAKVSFKQKVYKTLR